MHLQPKMELDMLVLCVWTNQMIQLFYPVKKQKLVNKIDIQNQNIWHMHWKIIKYDQKEFFFSSRTHHQGLIFKHHLVCVLNLSPLFVVETFQRSVLLENCLLLYWTIPETCNASTSDWLLRRAEAKLDLTISLVFPKIP